MKEHLLDKKLKKNTNVAENTAFRHIRTILKIQSTA